MSVRIDKAADMAGKWWAERLDDQHSDKREAFATEVAKRVKDALKHEGRVIVEVDYDADEILLASLHAAGIAHSGFMYGGFGILPTKTYIEVTSERLRPKEGYGNWTDDIAVPSS